MKKKPILIGITIGIFAKPILVRAFRPFRHKVEEKLYTLAFDFIQNFDANNS